MASILRFNVMFRRFLSRSPRALRFFVAVLACLQFVAPTWHICEMGGHPAAHRGAAHSDWHDAAHHAAISTSDDANSPLICFCAAHPKPIDPRTPRLDGVFRLDHGTCLAMLLQTLPGQVSAPLVLVSTSEIVAASLTRFSFVSPSANAPRRFPARAPPRKC